MTFIARVRRPSPLYSLWAGTNRVSGVISSTVFRKTGAEFVSGVLVGGEAAILGSHPDIILEMAEMMPKVAPEVVLQPEVSRETIAPRPTLTLNRKPGDWKKQAG